MSTLISIYNKAKYFEFKPINIFQGYEWRTVQRNTQDQLKCEHDVLWKSPLQLSREERLWKSQACILNTWRSGKYEITWSYWKFSRFLGIAWNTGDEQTNHIEISKHKSSNPGLYCCEPLKFMTRGSGEPCYEAYKRIDVDFDNSYHFDRIKPNIKILTNWGLKILKIKKLILF